MLILGEGGGTGRGKGREGWRGGRWWGYCAAFGACGERSASRAHPSDARGERGTHSSPSRNNLNPTPRFLTTPL